MRLAVALVLVLLAGCLASPSPSSTTTSTSSTSSTPPSPPDAPEPLAVRSLARGSFSGIHEDTRVAIGDADAWATFWTRHGKDGARPEVAFPQERVIAVVVHGPTGCFGIHIGNVTGTRVGTTVEVVHEETPGNVQCFVAIQDAYHFVAIPDRGGNVEFVDVHEASEGSYAFRTLDQGGSSGVHDELRRVIADEAEWLSFWKTHASNQVPAPPAPSVDFAKEHVLVVANGDKSNTCHDVRVERILVGPDNVTVEITTYLPGAGYACGQAITQPHHFVTYPVTDKPMVTRETVRSGSPNG